MDQLRVSDAERETAVSALSDHFAEGRLTKEEFDERSDAAWSARVRRDLDVLFFDLPGRPPPKPQRPVRAGRCAARGVLLPVLLVLVVVSVLTHLPIVLFGLLAYLGLRMLTRHR